MELKLIRNCLRNQNKNHSVFLKFLMMCFVQIDLGTDKVIVLM